MRNRNLWVILAAIVLIVAVVLIANVLPSQRYQFSQGAASVEDLSETPIPASTLLPVESGITVTETPADAAEATPVPEVKAYLLLTVQGLTYQPIPLYEEHDYTIRQQDRENVIHVTPDSVCMKSSTCENQDCVQQGTVSLENYKDRILYNMVLCLPNQVYLELYTPEELMSLLAQWSAEDTQTNAESSENVSGSQLSKEIVK